MAFGGCPIVQGLDTGGRGQMGKAGEVGTGLPEKWWGGGQPVLREAQWAGGFADSLSYGQREGPWRPDLEYFCLSCERVWTLSSGPWRSIGVIVMT